MAREAQDIDWTAVIARTLGFLCIHQAKLQDETLVKQADFLERFGIPRSEAAVPAGVGQIGRDGEISPAPVWVLLGDRAISGVRNFAYLSVQIVLGTRRNPWTTTRVAIVQVAQMCSKRCPGSNLRTPQAGFKRVVFPRISPLPTGSDLLRPGSYAWTFASA